jgi:hypothetical protein
MGRSTGTFLDSWGNAGLRQGNSTEASGELPAKGLGYAGCMSFLMNRHENIAQSSQDKTVLVYLGFHLLDLISIRVPTISFEADKLWRWGHEAGRRQVHIGFGRAG